MINWEYRPKNILDFLYVAVANPAVIMCVELTLTPGATLYG